ncbi:CC0125/CC1285 family lipoprotein [Hyphomonas johnsonii]|jgi:hypothetical protein|uniref:Putative lipoprotein n=1 Tax=Hyphomonas johnsonii MHS-2 TaxID=1280950 RepID=A0A059FPW1_9PROT|nr:hypothetical protein [Hyphomonas johnsonii]KCZ92657.1 putative lipoprotein [Hyphomonas johnsonii MHS-2]
MAKLNLAAGLAALFLLGACTTATPYQAAMDTDRGYSEQQIESNRFQVQFAGNSLTDRKTVETYMLYRAAELTKENGFDNFRVVQRTTDSKSRAIPVGSGYSPFYDHFALDYRYFGPRAGYFYDPYRRWAYPRSFYASRFGYYDPFWDGPQEYREVTSYVASAEIVMSKGEKPDDPAYFDADQVIFNLGTQIQRPES